MGMGGAKPPTAPMAPQYSPAPAYQMPPDPAGVVPPVMSAGKIIGTTNQLEGFGHNVTTTNGKGKEKTKFVTDKTVPQSLQLTNVTSQEEAQRARDYWMQMYGNPAESQARQEGFNKTPYSSYAGAQLGQLQSQNALNSYLAGQQKQQQDYGNLLAGRTSYFQGIPQIAMQQNALDVNRGLGIGQLQTQNYGDMNKYNLGASGQQNTFNSNIYGTQGGIYGNQMTNYTAQQQQSSPWGLAAQAAGTYRGGIT